MTTPFTIAAIFFAFLAGTIEGWMGCARERDGRGGSFPAIPAMALLAFIVSLTVGITLKLIGANVE